MQSSVIPSQVLYGTAHVKGDVVPFLWCSTWCSYWQLLHQIGKKRLSSTTSLFDVENHSMKGVALHKLVVFNKCLRLFHHFTASRCTPWSALDFHRLLTMHSSKNGDNAFVMPLYQTHVLHHFSPLGKRSFASMGVPRQSRRRVPQAWNPRRQSSVNRPGEVYRLSVYTWCPRPLIGSTNLSTTPAVFPRSWWPIQSSFPVCVCVCMWVCVCNYMYFQHNMWLYYIVVMPCPLFVTKGFRGGAKKKLGKRRSECVYLLHTCRCTCTCTHQCIDTNCIGSQCVRLPEHMPSSPLRVCFGHILDKLNRPLKGIMLSSTDTSLDSV